MMGLWADGWFYISSAGLCISGVLFFFLLGQYRVASEAADATEGEHAEAPGASPAAAPIRPVYIPDESRPAQVTSHAPEAKPAEYAGPERRKDPSATTGGISPAVVYMQNIKVELAALHEDVRALAKRVDNELAAVSSRDEALIERLAELTRAVEGKAPSEAAPAPAPKKPRKEKAPEPAIELGAPPAAVTLSAPKPEPKPEPVPVVETPPVKTPEETIRMDLGTLITAQEAPAVPPPPPPAAEPAPAPAAEPAPAAAPEEKPRRGPVWPV